MGAYCLSQWSVTEMWKNAVRKRQKLILNPHYGKAMYDEYVMAMVSGDTKPLMEKVLLYSLPSEHESVKDLFSSKVDITFINGNLVISN